MKIVIVLALFAVIAALFSSLYFMMTDDGSSKRMVNALTLRVALSLGIIALLALSYFMGWIEPHGVVP